MFDTLVIVEIDNIKYRVNYTKEEDDPGQGIKECISIENITIMGLDVTEHLSQQVIDRIYLKLDVN